MLSRGRTAPQRWQVGVLLADMVYSLSAGLLGGLPLLPELGLFASGGGPGGCVGGGFAPGDGEGVTVGACQLVVAGVDGWVVDGEAFVIVDEAAGEQVFDPVGYGGIVGADGDGQFLFDGYRAAPVVGDDGGLGVGDVGEGTVGHDGVFAPADDVDAVFL